MRVTRRGWGVLAIIALSLLLAQHSGSRSLNALVVPLGLVFLAGLVTTYRTEQPRLHRKPVEEGFIGQSRTVEIAVEVERPLSATVTDRVGTGVQASGNHVETTLTDGEPLTYEIDLEARGEHRLGPLSVSVTDLFGLLEKQFRYSRTTPVLVYPDVYDLRGGAKHDLQLLTDAVDDYDREEFDHLREYERGDDLRDIHWKAVAKRGGDDLIVKEFLAEGSAGSSTIAATSHPDWADELATAVASVATYLLAEDVAVGIASFDHLRDPDTGEYHELELLRALATLDGTEASEHEHDRADIVVLADASGVVVRVDGHEIPFERLCGRRLEVDSDPSSGPSTHREPHGPTASDGTMQSTPLSRQAEVDT